MNTLQSEQQSIPPCALDVWEQGIHKDDLCAGAIARLLLARPDLITQMDSLGAAEECLRQAIDQETSGGRGQTPDSLTWLLGLAQLLNMTGQAQEADALFNRAIDTVVDSGVVCSDTTGIAALADRMDYALRKTGRDGAARGIRRRLQVQLLMARNDGTGYVSLREAAFEAFQTGHFAEAERIYHHLLAHNFEPAGTRCHLARVLLLSAREAEARQAVEAAWENRAGAELYIVVRVQFFRALFATLAGQDASPYLAAITEALQNTGSRNSWQIACVLDALRPRLGDAAHAQFMKLATAVSDPVA